MTTPNFSRKPTAAPIQPQFNPQQIQQATGGLPMSRTTPYVSSSTAQSLAPFGYQTGDPLPDGLAERLAEMQKSLRADDKAYVDANRPTEHTSVRPQRVMNLTDLPEDHKREITELLAQAKMIATQPTARPVAMNPNMASAVQQVQAMSADPRVVNDLAGPAPPNFAKKPPSPPPSPSPEVRAAAKAAAAEEMQAIHAEPSPPEHSHIDLGGMPARYTHCPRCAYDLARDFDTAPDDTDRKGFLVAVLGQNRFTKSMEILDGELVITFRSLTADESQMILQQLSYDQRNGTVNTQGDYWMKLMDYRLCLSVSQVTTKDGRALTIIPPLDKIPYDPPEDGKLQTPLVPMLVWFNKEALTNEFTRRMIGQQHRQFQRIVEALEAQATEPSFWKGIATQL